MLFRVCCVLCVPHGRVIRPLWILYVSKLAKCLLICMDDLVGDLNDTRLVRPTILPRCLSLPAPQLVNSTRDSTVVIVKARLSWVRTGTSVGRETSQVQFHHRLQRGATSLGEWRRALSSVVGSGHCVANCA